MHPNNQRCINWSMNSDNLASQDDSYSWPNTFNVGQILSLNQAVVVVVSRNSQSFYSWQVILYTFIQVKSKVQLLQWTVYLFHFFPFIFSFIFLFVLRHPSWPTYYSTTSKCVTRQPTDLIWVDSNPTNFTKQFIYNRLLKVLLPNI